MLLLISNAGGRFPWGMRQSSREQSSCGGLHAYPTGVVARSEGQPNKNYENQQQTITDPSK